MWIELDGWMAKLRFSACHLIPGHPKCGRLHGHTYAVSVKIYGERTDEFIIDFELLKETVAEICNHLDHHIIVAKNDSRLRITASGDSIIVDIGEKNYHFPIDDVVFIPTDSTSAESLCEYVASELAYRMPSNISKIEVRIDEGIGQGAGCDLNIEDT
ncbi:MAG: 6-pyruvoyl tetrahydropterin synthase family protein [Euryarchaeota archaeon]|nr:6-pyruvoyl tetrahydropterin synthase family protein [Euryarchaeota archaeon]